MSSLFIVGLALLLAASAQALPDLQLGPDSGDWTYVDTDGGDNGTWIANDAEFSLLATATDTAFTAGNTTQTAYLVVYSSPKGTSDAFNILLDNDGGVTLVASGFGTAPENDPNTPAHGVSDNNTYYQVFEFQFDGAQTTIGDTEPGVSDTGLGYTETFDVTVLSLGEGTGLHFDLFTVAGDGIWDPTASNDNKLVQSMAPPSHDAGYQMPEPNAALLFGIGTLVVSARARRRC